MDIKICVIGSVDGVIIAAKIVEITITYFHTDNIFLPEIILNSPRITWIMGTWKDKPVVKISTERKFCPAHYFPSMW